MINGGCVVIKKGNARLSLAEEEKEEGGEGRERREKKEEGEAGQEEER